MTTFLVTPVSVDSLSPAFLRKSTCNRRTYTNLSAGSLNDLLIVNRKDKQQYREYRTPLND